MYHFVMTVFQQKTLIIIIHHRECQLREWDESREQDWDILKYPLHDAFHRYMIELNRIGQENDAFWHDYDPENFKWLDCHQEERCIYAIKRKGKNKNFIAIFNFSDEEQEDYELDTEEEGKLSDTGYGLGRIWRKYKKEKDIAGKSKKRDACDAGPAAVFGDFAVELGDGKGTPGAERYFCWRALKKRRHLVRG